MTEKYDLSVAYRIYPKISKRPPVITDNKYKLAELCLKSFKNSLGSLKVKMFVLLDNCPSAYMRLFEKYFEKEHLDFRNLGGVGNYATFDLQIKILLEQNYSEVIYFAEDDYFYMPDQFEEMINFFKENNDVDFVSPYDHLDYYTLELHNHPSYIKATDKRHWRTASSTCLTFLTDKSTLKDTKNVFETYTRGNLDSILWLSLTKYNPLRRLNFIRCLKKRQFPVIIMGSWRYSARQILFGRKWKLWTPMPTIAIHMESNFLPPTKACIDFMKNEAMNIKY